MENKSGDGRSTKDRRELYSQSSQMPVPTIVLNPVGTNKSDPPGLSHSRSAGDLDLAGIDGSSPEAKSSRESSLSKLSGSLADGIHESESRHAIGLYCSPRLPRRSIQSEMNILQRQAGGHFDSLNVSSLNCLDPGSRVGSSISLNSEYTSRSIGLISNDSSTECSNYSFGLMDSSFQKHSVLKRFYSSPEKDEDLYTHANSVRRNSKSMGNMQEGDTEQVAPYELESDFSDENYMTAGHVCDAEDSLSRTPTSSNPPDVTLVTAVTGGTSLRNGRIQKWLNEISVQDEDAKS